MQEQRRRNPQMAQYHRLKSEARKRKKVFTITRAEWLELCRLTRYHEGTASKCGSVKYGLTIDRIEHHKGYSMGNIRVIVNHENSRKGSYEMTCRLKNGKHVQLRAECVSVAEQLKISDEELIERI
jgi:hypothetical protein